MVLGLSVHAFTLLHVAISLIAIGAGIIFFIAVSRGRWPGTVNAVFLAFTILTSATGFLFPPKPIGPPHIFGAVSLVLLAVALYALYGARLGGGWRRVYLATTLIAQWLNMVVLVVQSYQKIPALHALAPTGGEPAVLLSQTAVLIAVAAAAWMTLRRRA
ncbi:hypothetical protein EWE75_11605 [Sphingomonas populi]|uniref:DUF2306 domain-containing protein n=1 Tax=Sphingomonas populi TaxID=2484750 RepID=A0A4Q6XVJ9_9SPHN|nr:hypothetical protein [Sphingomonas populi]RZF64390.1 hypothetical protein EWE75_11605 [Sphingomonas populi]